MSVPRHWHYSNAAEVSLEHAETAFAQAASRPPLPVIRHGNLSAKQEHAGRKNGIATGPQARAAARA
jgi:hypothetical protein